MNQSTFCVHTRCISGRLQSIAGSSRIGLLKASLGYLLAGGHYALLPMPRGCPTAVTGECVASFLFSAYCPRNAWLFSDNHAIRYSWVLHRRCAAAAHWNWPAIDFRSFEPGHCRHSCGNPVHIGNEPRYVQPSMWVAFHESRVRTDGRRHDREAMLKASIVIFPGQIELEKSGLLLEAPVSKFFVSSISTSTV